MCLFIETIRLEDGRFRNLRYHQERFSRTRQEVFGLRKHPLLEEELVVPAGLGSGVFKYRVLYGRRIGRLEIEPYERRKIRSLRIVRPRHIDYRYKYLDRENLDRLFGQRGSCDDIVVVVDDCITDSSSANTAFWDGSEWVTPDTPLLPGTMRAWLIDRGLLRETRITTGDLGKYLAIRLINALNGFDEGEDIPVEKVVTG